MRNIIGALSSHSFISHGVFIASYLAGSMSNCIQSEQQMAHIDDFLHVIPSKLLTPDETLNTIDRNQKKFTIFRRLEELSEIDI